MKNSGGNSHLGTLGLDWLHLGLENKSLMSVGINFESKFLHDATPLVVSQ